jgi:HSP20 family protein
MANITRRNELSRNERNDWNDPWERMRELMRWDPFSEMGRGRGSSNEMIAPAFDVRETEDAYLIEADLPGFEEDDVDVSVSGNRLTVSGKRENKTESKRESYYYSERSYGSFSRSFVLPDGTDSERIQADMKNGVLTLQVPKAAATQPRKIQLSKRDAANEPQSGQREQTEEQQQGATQAQPPATH